MNANSLIVIIFMLCSVPFDAPAENGIFEIASDRFLAGSNAVQDKEGVDDLFMFGETVHSEKNITGSAHMFGRKVVSKGDIGRDAYLAGMDVTQQGKVSGDLTVSGVSVQVGEVAGDLRAAGERVILSGIISGYALIAGEEVEFKAHVKGDVRMNAQAVKFSQQAQIEGTLTVFEKQVGAVHIPTHVIAEDRIVRRHISEWDHAADEVELWSWQGALGALIKWVVIITLVAALIAALVPQKLADLRRSILDQPLKNLFYGFLTMSVAIGSTIVLLITGYGILLVPVTLAMAFLCVFAGYVVGAYAIGVGLLLLAKQPEPTEFRVRALAAGIGALVAVIVAMIPVIGWLIFLSITFVGLGSVFTWLFRPHFFSTTQ